MYLSFIFKTDSRIPIRAGAAASTHCVTAASAQSEEEQGGVTC